MFRFLNAILVIFVLALLGICFQVMSYRIFGASTVFILIAYVLLLGIGAAFYGAYKIGGRLWKKRPYMKVLMLLPVLFLLVGDDIYRAYELRKVCREKKTVVMYDGKSYQEMKTLAVQNKWRKVEEEAERKLWQEFIIEAMKTAGVKWDMPINIQILEEEGRARFIQFRFFEDSAHYFEFTEKLPYAQGVVDIENGRLIYEAVNYRRYSGWLTAFASNLGFPVDNVHTCRSKRLGGFGKKNGKEEGL